MAVIARAHRTIADINDPIQQGAAPSSPVEGMLWLDISQSPPVLKRWSGSEWEQVNKVEVGGVNLISDSETYSMDALEDNNKSWEAVGELQSGTTYTLSVREIIRNSGMASGVTWELVNADTSVIAQTGTLDFTYGKQTRLFTVPETEGDWTLVLYAGLKGATSGVSVTYNKIKLEEGTVATSWSASPADVAARIGDAANAIGDLDEGMEARVQALIDAMNLSGQFASAAEFLEWVGTIADVKSSLAQQDDRLTVAFDRLTANEGDIARYLSQIVLGDDDGEPYIDMSTSKSSVKMRLSNTRLAFVQGVNDLAYFSDNKLYVTRLEVVEQVSVGTSLNGFLDIVTTPSGVGFKWRS